MKVLRSDVIGYCFGVEKTIEKARNLIEQAKAEGLPCYSIGEIIHNKDVTENFAKNGLNIIRTPEDVTPGIAIVRAHGIPDRERKQFLDAGFRLLDSTCPIVAIGANIIRKAAQNGSNIIILGVKGHAETIFLQGLEVNGTPIRTTLVCSMEDARSIVDHKVFGADDQIAAVVQTTFNDELFSEIKDYLKGKFNNIRFANSTCEAPRQRINAALNLAEKVDAIIVIGGKRSENTKNLALSLKDTGKSIYHIENVNDLTQTLRSELSAYNSVGICSGSSTPAEVVDEVEKVLLSI